MLIGKQKLKPEVQHFRETCSRLIIDGLSGKYGSVMQYCEMRGYDFPSIRSFLNGRIFNLQLFIQLIEDSGCKISVTGKDMQSAKYP